ncbi:hypothetical protein KQI41_01495 [Tissierella pigra]|nr:hypothetical protein [Tissierella pigra]MBU5425071.1 hypothetical protein [Tissierella pigra]
MEFSKAEIEKAISSYLLILLIAKKFNLSSEREISMIEMVLRNNDYDM